MKKLLALLPLTFMILTACENSKSEETSLEESSESTSVEPIDYGKVSFVDLTVLKDFDGVQIIPIFTKPEVCQNVKFTYTLADDQFVELDSEDNRFYYIANGTTKVTASSEEFEDVDFFVSTVSAFENGDFVTKIKKNTVDRLAADEGGTLFMGDSFFEFWKNRTGITESFKEAFSGKHVYNIGISATQTKHWRGFINSTSAYPVVPQFNPKNIIVNLGINDVDDSGLTGLAAGKNVLSLLLALHNECPDAKIYWVTVTHCSGVFAGKWNQHETCNAYVTKCAESYEFLNIIDLAGAYGADYAKYEQDGLHPNQAGYDLLKGLIYDQVELDDLD